MRFCNSTLLTRTRAGLFLSLLGTLRGRAGFEFVARIRRLACRDGWCRRTTPSVTLDPRCRSRPMLIAVTVSRNSGAGSRTDTVGEVAGCALASLLDDQLRGAAMSLRPAETAPVPARTAQVAAVLPCACAM